MKNSLAITIGAAALAVTTIAWAATPAQTIAARQDNFKAMGRANKAISDELKKASPDLALVRTQAAAVHQAGARVAGLFPRGTGPQTGIKTGALPAIWVRSREFTAANTRLVNAARGLENAARSNNVDAVKTAMRTLGGTCKGCHDEFKAKD
jgi:cytochrome c556